jgi:hypothetical protein
MNKSHYFLTLNREIIFVGNKKATQRKRKELKRKGAKVTMHYSVVAVEDAVGTLI